MSKVIHIHLEINGVVVAEKHILHERAAKTVLEWQQKYGFQSNEFWFWRIYYHIKSKAT